MLTEYRSVKFRIGKMFLMMNPWARIETLRDSSLNILNYFLLLFSLAKNNVDLKGHFLIDRSTFTIKWPSIKDVRIKKRKMLSPPSPTCPPPPPLFFFAQKVFCTKKCGPQLKNLSAKCPHWTNPPWLRTSFDSL